MSRNHTQYYTLNDEAETEIIVEYTYSPGCLEQGPSYASGGQPAEPPEVELVGAWMADNLGKKMGEEIELTEFYASRIHIWLMENHEPEEREDYK